MSSVCQPYASLPRGGYAHRLHRHLERQVPHTEEMHYRNYRICSSFVYFFFFFFYNRTRVFFQLYQDPG